MGNKVVTHMIVTGATDLDTGKVAQEVALFNPDGTPWDPDTQTGGEVILTGYVVGASEAVDATDTANEAIGKLEARIVALESA